MEEACEEVEKLMKQGHFKEALVKIEESGAQPRDSPQLWTSKAKCLEILRKSDDAFDAAIKVYDVSHGIKEEGKLRPSKCHFSIYNTLGEGYVRRREYDLADDMFWEAGNVCPNEGLQAMFLDKHKELDAYSKALKFFEAQQFKRALDKIEVLGAEVKFPVLWVLKLRCLLKLNRAEDADEVKSQILDISAKNVTVLFDLGESYMEEGDYVSALEVYAKGVDSAQDQKIKFSFTEEFEKAQHMKNKGEQNQYVQEMEAAGKETEVLKAAEVLVEVEVAQAETEALKAAAETEETETEVEAAGKETEVLKAAEVLVEVEVAQAETEALKAAAETEETETEVEAAKTKSFEALKTSTKSASVKDEAFNPYGCKFSVDLEFSLDKHLQHDVYSGKFGDSSFNLDSSFIGIDYKNFQVEDLLRLRLLAAQEKNVLHFNFFIKEKPKMQRAFLVVDKVLPVDKFFEIRLEEFNSNEEISFCDTTRKRIDLWWKWIKTDFKQIFRDVVHGLMYLYEMQLLCGSIHKAIFVTEGKRGKILPSLDAKSYDIRGVKEDMRQLVMKMKSILFLPFKDLGVGSSTEVPFPADALELYSLFECLRGEKLKKKVPVSWLINHTFFWTPMEGIGFIKMLKNLIKQKVIWKNKFDQILWQRKSFFEEDWCDVITEESAQSVYRKIFEYPDKNNNVGKYRPVPTDSIRYMNACFSHVNDGVRRVRALKEVEIYAHLMTFFPTIHVTIFEALYDYACQCWGLHTAHDVLKNLSSSCTRRDLYETL